jgi:hypothetical protein
MEILILQTESSVKATMSEGNIGPTLSRIQRTAVRIAASGARPKLSSVVRVIVVGHS